jgi:hypothetical protein
MSSSLMKVGAKSRLALGASSVMPYFRSGPFNVCFSIQVKTARVDSFDLFATVNSRPRADVRSIHRKQSLSPSATYRPTHVSGGTSAVRLTKLFASCPSLQMPFASTNARHSAIASRSTSRTS